MLITYLELQKSEKAAFQIRLIIIFHNNYDFLSLLGNTMNCNFIIRNNNTTWINELGAEYLSMIREISAHKIKGQII